MKILGIESSCDETGLALYDLDRGLLSHALHSQIAMHQAYGGVVPELASRDHIQRLLPLLQQVLDEAQCEKSEIDAIACTVGPGLAGALLVGTAFAHAFGYALGKPIIPIHHLEGHLLSPLLAAKTPSERPAFPFIALLVSGGHTQLMQVNGVGDYVLLGETLDDAAGEAFDKSAKLMGLSYPGGPALSALAEQGTPGRFNLPRPMLHSKDLDFSFSGLKTAVLTVVKQQTAQAELTDTVKAEIARAFQDAIVEVLVAKCLQALKQTGLKQLVIAGGVGANKQLRAGLNAACAKRKVAVYYPDLQFCTDNGAMIAFAGALRVQAGLVDLSQTQDYSFTVKPRWDLADLAL